MQIEIEKQERIQLLKWNCFQRIRQDNKSVHVEYSINVPDVS